MASTEQRSREMSSPSIIQHAPDDPVSKIENTTENHNGATHGKPKTSPQTQTAERSDMPLSRGQILDIKQPMAQFIINSLLQAAAFAVTIAFGIFAVKSVEVADAANNSSNQAASEAADQALTANQLTLLTFCFAMNASQVSNFNSICSRVVKAADSMITGAASALFTNLPPPTTTSLLTSHGSSAPSSSAGSTDSSSSDGRSVKSGIIAGVVVGVLVFTGVAAFFILRRRRAPHVNSDSADPHTIYATTFESDEMHNSDESQPLLQRKSFGKWVRETFMDTKVVSHME